MLTREQLIERQKGIGGSDAGVILGLSTWKTPVELWLEKTGPPPEPEEPTEEQRWGHLIEPLVAQRGEEMLDLKFRKRKTSEPHPLRPWMLASVDREVIGEPSLVEIKTIGFHWEGWGREWTDEIPPVYVAQCVHYMAVRDMDRVYVLAFFMGSRQLRIYEIQRDREVEDMLISQEANFWHNHVQKRVPPEPMNPEDVERLNPEDNGLPALANPEITAAVNELHQVKEQADKLKAREEVLKKQIQQYMGKDSILVDIEQKPLVTWKLQSTFRLDTKAITKAHPRLVEGFKKEQKSRKFLLK